MRLPGKWWRGQKVVCRECGEQIELEDTDLPRHGHTYFVEVDCPVCAAVVNVPHTSYGAEVPRTPILASHDTPSEDDTDSCEVCGERSGIRAWGMDASLLCEKHDAEAERNYEGAVVALNPA